MSSNEATPVPDKWHYSWDEFDMHAHRLVEILRANNVQTQAVLALGRGASPLGAALANIFGVRMYYWGLSSYNPHNQQEYITVSQSVPQVLEKMMSGMGQNLLLVDDIWDTGRTFQWAAGSYPEAKRVCLVHKPEKNESSLQPDFVAAETRGHVWVEFPWEKNYG